MLTQHVHSAGPASWTGSQRASLTSHTMAGAMSNAKRDVRHIRDDHRESQYGSVCLLYTSDAADE